MSMIRDAVVPRRPQWAPSGCAVFAVWPTAYWDDVCIQESGAPEPDRSIADEDHAFEIWPTLLGALVERLETGYGPARVVRSPTYLDQVLEPSGLRRMWKRRRGHMPTASPYQQLLMASDDDGHGPCIVDFGTGPPAAAVSTDGGHPIAFCAVPAGDWPDLVAGCGFGEPDRTVVREWDALLPDPAIEGQE